MLLIGLSIFACGGTTTTYSGHTTNSYMALDGERSWTYSNDGLPYTLEIEKIPETEMSGDTEIVTLEYSVEDPAQLLGSVAWSSDSRDGILIHGYDSIRFEEPIQFAEYRMSPGGIATTETDGAVFTSTFIGVETCENLWITEGEPWECLRFTIESDEEGYPFTGDYWLANAWGPSRFINTDGEWGSENTWVLNHARWTDESE